MTTQDNLIIVQKNDLAVGAPRPAVDFKDSGGGTWTINDDVINERITVVYNPPGSVASANNLQKGYLLITPSGSTYGIDCSLASYFRMNHAGSRTISNPTNTTGINQIWMIIKNTSGGAITTTWGAQYHFDGVPWVDPAAGKLRVVGWILDATDAVWYECHRSAGDIT